MAGHHTTISVRNEDELDMKIILDKVSKVSASAYNFKEKPQGNMNHLLIINYSHRLNTLDIL